MHNHKKTIQVVLYSLFILLFLSNGNVSGQNNVPSSNIQPAPTQPVNPRPAAYDAGVRLNYFRTWEPAIPLKDSAAVAADRPYSEVRQTTEYGDGFGRAMQSIVKKGSTGGKDLVTPYYYDSYGKQSLVYLPYVQTRGNISDGRFKTDPFLNQENSYADLGLFQGEKVFYSKTELERSPISRVLRTFAPGNSWAGSNVGSTMSQSINTVAEEVKIWRINSTIGALPTLDGNYPTGELMKSIFMNEQGKITVAYKTRDGKILLSKTQLDNSTTTHSGWLCTYYIYNDLGQLRYIVSPKAVELFDQANWNISNTNIWDGLCERYDYDAKGRVIVHKTGGAGEMFFVYDNLDRVVFAQTALQRQTNDWVVTFYDELSRPVMTALYNTPKTRAQLQADMTAVIGTSTVTTNYQAEGIENLVLNQRLTADGTAYKARSSVELVDGFETPAGDVCEIIIDPTLKQTVSENIQVFLNPLPNITGYKPLTFTYYDNYGWNGAHSFDTRFISNLAISSRPNAETVAKDDNVAGAMTGKKVLVLGTDKWLTSTFYYDNQRRIIQISEDNISGNTDVVTSGYNFGGQMLASHTHHENRNSSTNPVFDVLTTYAYNSAGDIESVTKAINNDSKLTRKVVTNTYNELGQLQRKVLGNDLESLDYEYNIRGWLRGINKDYVRNGGSHYFGTELFYDYGYTQNMRDGNVSGITWRAAGDGVYRSYGYQYDAVNHLKQAYYTQNNGAWSQTDANYTVDNLLYDANGNISSMKSMSTFVGETKAVDNLTYQYAPHSNRLEKVTDAAGYNQQNDFKDGTNTTAPDYVYDNDGNLLTDANKDLTITWNYIIGKPELIKVGATNDKHVRYVYNALGERLQKIVTDGNTITTYKYIDGFVYRDEVLSYFNHESGRVRQNHKGELVYDYFITDQQSTVRTVLTEEKDIASYLASFEPARNDVENATIRNREITKEQIPTVLPWYNSQQNQFWSKLNNTDPNKRIGASIILKVMTGDVIDLKTKAYYKTQPGGVPQSSTPADQMLTNVLQAFLGSNFVGIGKGDLQQGEGAVLNMPELRGFINNVQQQNNGVATSPKAYLNYVLFDEQFKMVSGNVARINKGPDALNEYLGHLDVTKSGYLYVYTSNESPMDVWFDDVQVVHQAGPLLQEATLYPYGLEIAALTNRPLLSTANDNIYQQKELDEDLGVNLNYFEARYYDPQTGRFISLDPAGQFASGYIGMANSPMLVRDPNGKWAIVDDLISMAIGGAINLASNLISGNVGSFWEGIQYFAVGAAAGEATIYGGPLAGGAILGLGNSLTQQGWKDINIPQTIQATGMGAATSVIAGAAGQGIGTAIGPAISNIVSKVGSPVIRTALERGISGTVVGFTIGAGFSIATGGDPIADGLQGAAVGLTGGIVTGGVSGLKLARELGRNPWSGRLKLQIDELPTLRAAPIELAADATSIGTPSLQASQVMDIKPLKLTTSSKGGDPKIVYTIYQADGTLYKFGVSDVAGKRLRASLRKAGDGAYFRITNEMTKSEAHLVEKYLRSLYYNSTGDWVLPGMKVPFPVNFDTGKRISNPDK